MKKIVILLVVAGIIIGCGFGISKLISPEKEAPAATTTWFSANLPGAMQHCFLSFDNVRDFDYVKAELDDATLMIEDEALVLKTTNRAGMGAIKSNKITFLDNYLRNKQDVIVVDFDVTFSSGIPDTSIGLSDLDLTGLTGSSDTGVYKYGTTNLTNKSLKFTDTVHITLLYFTNSAKINAYVNGFFVNTQSAFYSTPELTILGGARATEEGIGVMKLDNVEVTTFGDGNGTYEGVLTLYKDNYNLNIGELMGVHK